MLERNKMERGIFEIVDTESLVPVDHLLRKIDAAIQANGNAETMANTGRGSSRLRIMLYVTLKHHASWWR